MNLLSFNIRGLGGGLKQAALKILLDSVCLVVVFIQETMSSGLDACNFFLHLSPGWLVNALATCGNSGGTLVAWNPIAANLRDFKFV